RSLAAKDAVNSVALSPDGKMIAGACKDGTVKVWNNLDNKELFNLTGHAGPVLSVAFSANNLLLVSTGADRTVRFWNAANGQPVAVVGAHTAAGNAVVFNPNNVAAYSTGDDGVLKFWTVPPTVSRNLAAPPADLVTAV